MRSFQVTLRIDTDNGNPVKWDWPDLIGDDAAVVDVQELDAEPTMPYVQREQSARNADETTYVVLCDIVDVLCDTLDDEGIDEDTDAGRARKAKFQERNDALANAISYRDEARSLWGDDDAPVDGWLDADESEQLQGLLNVAEGLPGISVDWDGEAGTVTIRATNEGTTHANHG